MKKFLTLLSALVFCFSLAVPTFGSSQAAQATPQAKAATATKATKKVKATKKAKAATVRGKRHLFHARRKGATEGLKKGQQGTNPGQATKQ